MSIPNDIIGSANVSYLGDPFEQYCGLNGKPLIGGHIEVYLAGTSDKYMTLQDFDGDYNPFKVPLGADGRVVMLADPSLTYDIYVYNSYNDLVCSRLNVECTCPGNISIKGADTWVRNTDGTLDISLRTSANNRRVFDVNTRNKLLDVQSPLYFVENSETATVIGFSGDDFASKEYVDSAVSSKLDTSAFSNVSGDFLTDKFEYDDDNHITAYNHSAFAGGGGSGPNYEAGDHIDITDNVISVTGLPDSADLENAISSAVTNVENKFEYNENNYITAYNNSAFAGKEYSAGDGISIVNDVISVTSEGGGIEQVSHDDTLSGNGNSDPLGIANIEDFVKQNDLTAYQHVGEYYSASNPSGFITNDAITGLQPSGDYVTHDELTAYQPTGDYATHDDLTAYATTALVSSVSSELYSAISGISGDYKLVAGEGVELVDDPTAKTTTINVTAEGTPVTAIEQMIESATSGLQPSGDYATTAQVADKLDTTAFSTVSGSFLTAVDLTPYQTKADMTAYQPVGDYASATDLENYQPVSSMTAYQSAGDYYSASNPSGFITGVDLTPYQTTAGMTAYQPVGDYYSASNPSGFLTAVPESAVSGFIPYSATGVSLPNSNFEIDASGQAYKIFATHSTATYTISNNEVTAENLNLLENDVLQFTNLSTMVQQLSADINGDVFSLTPVMTESNTRSAELVYPYNIEDVGVITLVGKFNGLTIKVTGTMTHISDRDEKLEYALKSDIPSTADFYPASNPSGFITGVPAGTLNESAFEYDANDKISGYNGSAFAGGSDVPPGTMNESGLEYDASGNISAYSGSAFAAQLPEEEEVEFEEIDISGISAATDYVTATSADINSTIDSVSANSGVWGGSALPISAGQGIGLSVSDNTLVVSAVPSAFYTLSISNIVLTASLPGTPNANTLYLIQE